MTRAEQLADRERRYAKAMEENRLKDASRLFAEMKVMRLKQLKAENRQDRHEYRV